jgi:hypothetical protein
MSLLRKLCGRAARAFSKQTSLTLAGVNYILAR